MKRCCLVIILAWSCQTSAQAIPDYISYQGRLTDATGTYLQGIHAVSFAIYDASETGTAVWGPFSCDGLSGIGHAARVVVWEGWFHVILGPADTLERPLSSAFMAHDGKPRFVEISVEGQKIEPRQQFLCNPYAFQATLTLDAENSVPPGCIMPYIGQEIPAGWLICNGSAIPASPEYAALRAVCGWRTPDLRGRMVLGVDGAADRVTAQVANVIRGASGAESHTLSVGEMPSHNHVWNYNVERDDSSYGGSYSEFTRNPGPYSGGGVYPIAHTGGGQAHNNMPPYVALNWIIKY